MFKILLYILIIFEFFPNCKVVELDHPAEGAGGLLIGRYNKQESTPPNFSLTGLPEKLEEGESVRVGIKLTQTLKSPISILISSENEILKIDNNSNLTLNFSPNDATVDQFFTISVPASNRTVPETVTLSVSGEGIQTLTASLIANYRFSRKIILTSAETIPEEATGTLTVKLGKEPAEIVSVQLSSNDPSSISFQASSLQFTPENYDQEQSVLYTINDTLNTNKTYSLIAQADGETKSLNVTVLDNDFGTKELDFYGTSPSLVFDSSNNKFHILSRSLEYKSTLTSCNLDFSICSNSFTSPNNSEKPILINGFSPGFNGLLYTNIDFYGAKPLYCNGSFSACDSSKDWSASFSWNPKLPKIKYSSTRSKIFISSGDDKSNQIAVYDFNTGNANLISMSKAHSAIGGVFSRGFDLDEVREKIISVHTGETIGFGTSIYVPVIQRMNYDGSGQETFYASFTDYIGFTPDLKIDSQNSKLFIVSNNQSQNYAPTLFICDLNTIYCGLPKDISSGVSGYSSFPKLNLDQINQKVLVISYNTNRNPYLYHCDNSGNNCKSTNISSGSTLLHDEIGPNFDSVIDTLNKRLIVVFTDGSTKKIKVIQFGLGGF